MANMNLDMKLCSAESGCKKNKKNTVVGMEKYGKQLYLILLHPECNSSTCHVPVNYYIKVDLFQTDW